MLDRAVIFLDEWVPYAARGAYLAEADVGVSAHLPGLETHFALRTRLLDYLWARLPVICTAGDSLGERFAGGGMGGLVPPHDLDGWVAAIRRLHDDPALRAACRAAADSLAAEFTWDRVARPLAAFCARPSRSPSSQPAASERMAELERALAQRDAQVADLEARAAWLEDQAHAARRELAAVQNGRLMRLLRWLSRT